MITVRFPNGQTVQYNSGNHVSRSQWGYADIYTKKDGAWLAQVPNACIIEWTPACRVYNAMKQNEDRRIEELTKEIRALKRKIGKVKS